MSQDTLAKNIGVTFQQVQKYERGTNRIGSSRLHKIAAALGVSVSFLFINNENPDVGVHIHSCDPILSKDALDLNKAFLKITDRGLRRSIIDFLISVTRNGER
jgi:transcriptional regulator with XRE-family HTH domain